MEGNAVNHDIAVKNDVATLLSRLRQLCAAVPDEHGASISITTVFTRDLLEADESETQVTCRWVAAATSAATVLARTDQARLAWRIAHVSRRLALVLLDSPGLTDSERRAMRGAVINLLGASGEAARSLSHPLTKAVAARQMIGFWSQAEGDRTYAEHIAMVIEEAVGHLLDRGRYAQARALIELTPASIREAHYHWSGVEHALSTWTKPAWSAPQSSAASYEQFRQSIEQMGRMGSEGARAVAAEALQRLGTGPPDPDRLREVALWLETVLETHGRVDELGKLRMDEGLAVRNCGTVQEAEDALVRLRDIVSTHCRFSRWEDAGNASRSTGRLLRSIGRLEQALEAFAEAIEYGERTATGMADVFSAGAFARTRSTFEDAIDCLCEGGKPLAALRLAEYCKSSVWRQVRGSQGPRPRDIVLGAPGLGDIRGFTSFFVAESSVFVFAVDGENEVRVHKLALSRERLAAVVGRLTANGWTQPGAFSPSNPSALRQLDILVQSLEPILTALASTERGVIISPDGILHNVPWHLLRAGERLLIETTPVHSVLGLEHMEWIRSFAPIRPGTASIYVAPARDQPSDGRWRHWGSHLAAEFLDHRIPARLLYGEEASAHAVISDLGHCGLAHIRCHGHFPQTGNADAQAAFTQSGLMLAVEDGLPYRSNVAVPSLTPAHIHQYLQPLGCLGTSHLSLEACVSGVVRDGVAGDPISLPWILMLRGLQSVVASHWNVAVDHAEAYFDVFYRVWIGEGRSRREAHCEATLHALSSYGAPGAAFSLIGDWR